MAKMAINDQKATRSASFLANIIIKYSFKPIKAKRIGTLSI